VSRRAWIAFAVISVVWGIPYLFIKLAVDGGMPPIPLAWARVTLAAILLIALAWRRGTLGALRGRWGWMAAYAIAEVSLPFPLIAFGETRVTSSMAAIVIASVPLIGAVLALRFDRSERPTRERALGLAVGFAGVIALVGVQVAASNRALLGTGALLLSALGYAIGPMLIKLKLNGLDPAAVMGGSLAIAAAMLTPLTIVDWPSRAPSAGALGSVAVLAVVCTAIAFVVFTILIREAGSGRAYVITYINPVVALALGVLLLGERPSGGAIAGLLLILAGSWLSTGGRVAPPRRRGSSAPSPSLPVPEQLESRP
jgi:drug/metabolite transporter (DMT)-like permease